MSGSRFFRGVGFSALALTLGAGAVIAQPPKGDKKPAEDISDKARNVKPELKEAYKRWLNTDPT